MRNEYINRSRVSVDEFEDEELRIGTLKAQTGWAIDEATAKNLLSQAKLKKALENEVLDSVEYKKERLNLAFIPLGSFIAGMGVFMTLKSKA